MDAVPPYITSLGSHGSNDGLARSTDLRLRIRGGTGVLLNALRSGESAQEGSPSSRHDHNPGYSQSGLQSD
jgi:hypothetical protein